MSQNMTHCICQGTHHTHHMNNVVTCRQLTQAQRQNATCVSRNREMAVRLKRTHSDPMTSWTTCKHTQTSSSCVAQHPEALWGTHDLTPRPGISPRW